MWQYRGEGCGTVEVRGVGCKGEGCGVRVRGVGVCSEECVWMGVLDVRGYSGACVGVAVGVCRFGVSCMAVMCPLSLRD